MNLPYILCLYFVGAYCSSLTVEYYKKLIEENLALVENFNSTQSSEEFRKAVELQEISDFGTYDFVIVGAGSAGSVLATRLSEVEKFKILLLEAGNEEDDFNSIPNAMFAIQTSKRNWAYLGVPNNKSCLASPDQRCQIPRGKGIGGSSSINGLMYVRCSPEDYNKWAQMGNLGWSYKDVLPYFIKSENSQVEGDQGYHGKGGLWNVENSLPPSDILQNFLDACSEMNIPKVDYNGRHILGASQLHYSIKHGKRQSTGAAFLDMGRKRSNLKVVTRALATKILIDSRSKTAEGVQFVTYDKKYTVKARKEVIVSGGAINSPQLLMLSGIGPKKHLEELGINVIADLPVGKNVRDHVSFPIGIKTNYSPPNISVEEQIQQYLHGYGPFTNAPAADGIVFLKTKPNSNVPTSEILFIPPSISVLSSFNGTYGVQQLAQINRGNVLLLTIILLDAKSIGEIKLKTKNPVDYPLVNENILSEQEDVDNVKRAIQVVLKMLKTEAFKKINASLQPFGVCKEVKENSDEYWNCLIHTLGNPFVHVSGSTQMGQNPSTSVVDRNLTVHGVKKLRVVDAGVFPTLVSGHTNAPTVMVAEKLSDVIKATYRFEH